MHFVDSAALLEQSNLQFEDLRTRLQDVEEELEGLFSPSPAMSLDLTLSRCSAGPSETPARVCARTLERSFDCVRSARLVQNLSRVGFAD